jgi:hypothetical protein
LLAHSPMGDVSRCSEAAPQLTLVPSIVVTIGLRRDADDPLQLLGIDDVRAWPQLAKFVMYIPYHPRPFG